MPNYVSNISNGSTSYPIGGTNFDGLPVISSYVLVESTAWAKNSATTYSLANCLPNDNYDYMVYFSGYTSTLSGSGNADIRVMSGTRTYTQVYNYGCRMMGCDYHSTSYYTCSNSLSLPIYASDRNVTVANTSSYNTGTNNGFYVVGYRRLGTNE